MLSGLILGVESENAPVSFRRAFLESFLESLSTFPRIPLESPSESIIHSIGALNATNTQNAVDQHIDYVRARHLDIDQTR